MFKDEILENERRKRIYTVIDGNPGIHLRELQRILDMPLATLEYHLSYMTRRKIVFSEKEGYHKRYYTKPLDPAEKRLVSALRQKRMREIVLLVLTSGKAKFQFLSDRLGLPHSTLSLYLKYLVENNILARERVGYENVYTIQNEDGVAKVLVAYKSSFLDTLVDKALATWLETHFLREKTNIQ